MTTKIYYTPLGEPLTYSQARKQGRLICPVCETAVIEDEYLPCENCDSHLCLYCWQAGEECTGCKRAEEEDLETGNQPVTCSNCGAEMSSTGDCWHCGKPRVWGE